MARRTREEMLRQGERVGEMRALLEAFLVGKATREEVGRWAEARKKEIGYAPFCVGNGTASCVFESLLGLDDSERGLHPAARREGNEFVVRRSDIERYVAWLAEGSPKPRLDEVMFVTSLTAREIGRMRAVQDVRWWVDGLGWHDGVQFASPSTGRTFLANSSLSTHHVPGIPGAAILAFEERSAALVADVFDTLGIDMDDVHPETISWLHEPVGAWSIWRQDDNGQRAVFARFTGYAKAKRRLAELDEGHHKQMYWLEEG